MAALLEDRDPDEPPDEAQALFPRLYSEEDVRDPWEPLAYWPTRLVRALDSHGRYLTDVEKDELVQWAGQIAGPRRAERRRQARIADEQFALAADEGDVRGEAGPPQSRPSPDPEPEGP